MDVKTDNAAIAIEDALRDLGVGEGILSASEKEVLDRNGYLIWIGLAEAVWLRRLRIAFEAAMDTGAASESGGSGTRHAEALAFEDAAFDGVYTHPKVLAAVHHLLQRPFRVFQMSGRDPRPGCGQQGLHTDWSPRPVSGPFSVVTAIWLLDEFTANNGATRVVPRSHLVPGPLPSSFTSPSAHHPDEWVVTAPAGSVLLFNGHLWHSGTRNESDRPRRVIQCQFVARDAGGYIARNDVVPQRLTPAARYILGV